MKTAAELLPLMQKAVASHKAGRFEEAERSYLSVLDFNPHHIDALKFLGALYVQQHRAEPAIDCLQKALVLNPDDPELLNNLGVALCHAGKTEEAIPSYRKAIRINPDYEDALINLGLLLCDVQRTEEALPVLEQALRKGSKNKNVRSRFLQLLEAGNQWDRLLACFKSLPSDADDAGYLARLGNYLRSVGRSRDAAFIYDLLVKLKPEDAVLRLNLGMIFHDLGDMDEALCQFDKALQLRPDFIDALVNRGSLLMEMNHLDEALASYDRVLQLQPQSLDAQWGKALACLALGDYRQGWALYEVGFARKQTRGQVPFAAPFWDGVPFPGKRLLIWGEQGLGDVLQFIRYASFCKQRGGTIIVMCREPLLKILKNCPFIDDAVLSASERDFDFHIPVMSLPRLFDTTLETVPAGIPYLYVDDGTRQKWRPRMQSYDGLKIGLVWAGNPRRRQIDAYVIDRRRSMDLSLFEPLFALKGAHFFSLQKGEAAAGVDACGLRDKLTDYMPEVEDFLDTAAIIENLDLVISVDTSVVHLAGGLGKPVWVLSRFDGCWRWLRNRHTSPWYPTARIFGQPSFGDWSGVVDQVLENLKLELSRRALSADTV